MGGLSLPSQLRATAQGRILATFGFLALAGLAAGVLMVALTVLYEDAEQFYSAFFGIFLVGYFVRSRGLRSAWKAMGFVASSVVAYIVAFWLAVALPDDMKFLNFLNSGSVLVSIGGLFVGGLAGAAILFAGFFLFLSDRKEWRHFVVKALTFSVMAGLVAVFTWKAGSFLGHRFSHAPASSDWDFYFLHVFWQAAVAASFGFFLPRQEASVASAPATSSSG